MLRLLPISLAAFLLLGALAGCSDAPKPLKVPEERLVGVLADLHIAEAALQALRGDTKDSMAAVYYDQIYTLHAVDSAAVHQSLEQLRKDPQRMKALYDRVMERVETLSATSKQE